MGDIFISYSSKDRPEAMAFADWLESIGYHPWIDRRGIDGAQEWNAEIVDAINQCTSFVLMLSPQSVGSPNVSKELHLASEKRKAILPLILEATPIPPSFEYSLAGIQHVSFADREAIVKALERVRRDIQTPDRNTRHTFIIDPAVHRLAVLPFEDLSADRDNEWFSEGLVDELIGTLAQLPLLWVPDRQTTKYYKNTHLKAAEIAHELNVRFIIEGSVRKQGEQIKISTMLIDTEANTHLWNDSFRGTMSDIFEIQERVAKEVASTLKIHLTMRDEETLSERQTDNPRAYELYLRAQSKYMHHTKEDLLSSLDLAEAATKIDPAFANAYCRIADACTSYYRLYDRSRHWIERAMQAAERAVELEPSNPLTHKSLSYVFLWSEQPEQAIAEAKKTTELNSRSSKAYYQLGFIYGELFRFHEAIEPLKRAIELDATALQSYSMLIHVYNYLQMDEAAAAVAHQGLPHFERAARLAPANTGVRSDLANLYMVTGNDADAVRVLEQLESETSDPLRLYNIGIGFSNAKQLKRGYTIVKRSFELGFQRFDLWEMLRANNSLTITPEVAGLIAEIDELIAERKQRQQKTDS